jgi:hypothetical protein
MVKWFHLNETPCRRIDTDAGPCDFWGLAYGSNFYRNSQNLHTELLADYLTLADQYLARTGVTVVRPEIRAMRPLYEAYSAMPHVRALGGGYDIQEQNFDIPLRPTNIANRAWLLHESRMRLAPLDKWKQQFLLAISNDLAVLPQYHATWFACVDDQTLSNWAKWVDVQTNWPPLPDTNAWRRSTRLKVVCPETMNELHP